MLTRYIQAAMRRATYEILSDGTFYGEIPGFQGVYAHASTLAECSEQLQEVLEGWIVLGLRLGHSLPEVDGIELGIPNPHESDISRDFLVHILRQAGIDRQEWEQLK